MHRGGLLKLVLVLTASACGTSAPPSDESPNDEGLTFDEAQWESVRALSPDTLPGPRVDVSNAWADDAQAAELGEQLFFETGFSGALLDVDNDGGPNSLGVKGETGRVSCAGCHLPNAAFTDTRSTFHEISLGAGWTTRKTPSLLDIGQASLVLLGGRHSTLHGQVFGPFENPLEMNTSRLYVATYVADHYQDAYEAVFGDDSLEALLDTERFVRLAADETGCQLTQPISHPRVQPPNEIYECHGTPGDGAEYDALSTEDQDRVTRVVVNVGKAIAAFERTLACGPGRFDAFVQGDKASLTLAEQRGLQLFIGKAGCTSCHAGPFLSDQAFHNIGVAQGTTREGITNNNDRGAALDLALALTDPLSVQGAYSDGDDGRLPDALGQELEGAFRTPTLRCASQRPSFMHTGLMMSLESVVAFKNRGGDPGGFPGTSASSPLGLTSDEVKDLVAFLKAL